MCYCGLDTLIRQLGQALERVAHQLVVRNGLCRGGEAEGQCADP